MSKRSRADAGLMSPEEAADLAKLVWDDTSDDEREEEEEEEEERARHIAGVVEAAAAVVATLSAPTTHAAGRRMRRVIKSRDYWLDVFPALDNDHFKRDYRISREVFRQLVDLRKEQPAFITKRVNLGTLIPVDKQLAVFLFRVAHAWTFRNLAVQFNLSEGAAHAACDRVLTALSQGPIPRAYITARFPSKDDLLECTEAAKLMARNGRFIFPNCIGALDCTHIPELNLRGYTATEKEAFIDRDGTPSQTVQVWNDILSCQCPASVYGRRFARSACGCCPVHLRCRLS